MGSMWKISGVFLAAVLAVTACSANTIPMGPFPVPPGSKLASIPMGPFPVPPGSKLASIPMGPFPVPPGSKLV
jgi:hypothetical protein